MLLIAIPDGTLDNPHLYGLVLIMRRLLKLEEFGELKDEIVALLPKHQFVNPSYYGFRED